MTPGFEGIEAPAYRLQLLDQGQAARRELPGLRRQM